MAITNQEQFNAHMAKRLAFYNGNNRQPCMAAQLHHGLLSNNRIRLIFNLSFKYDNSYNGREQREDLELTVDLGIPKATAERTAVVAKCLAWAKEWIKQDMQP